MSCPTIGVLTPTIGKSTLLDCLRSVASQTIPALHYLVIDGAEHREAVHAQVGQLPETSHIRLIDLQENVGRHYYGHRVYAAAPMLMNTDLVSYLDEDNLLSPTHLESMMRTLQSTQATWVYSLRLICDPHGAVLGPDNCESLGLWVAYGRDPGPAQFHIDTSCFCLPRSTAIMLGPAWYGQWGQDRLFFQALQHHAPSYACTGDYTVLYRLGGNPGSVQWSFFQQGNAVMAHRYASSFPWAHQESQSHAVLTSS